MAKKSPALMMRCNALVGECLCLISAQRGDLDDAWNVDASVDASATEMDDKVSESRRKSPIES